MKTSLKIRAAAAVASLLITFGVVWNIADYAYPEAGGAVMAAAKADKSR